MRTVIFRSFLALGFAALAIPAMAQTSRGGINPNSLIPKPSGASKPTVQPPAAVPGARARPDSVAPAGRATADLPPTEALFDAINRGDIATARDAVNRGADLDGTNVLGLTPLELSVDLSRNDITFLLLSMRGADSGSSQGGPPQQAAAAPSPAARRRGEHIVAERTVPLQKTAIGVAARESAPPVHQTAALYSGNGGAPLPSAGFLGFDPHH